MNREQVVRRPGGVVNNAGVWGVARAWQAVS